MYPYLFDPELIPYFIDIACKSQKGVVNVDETNVSRVQNFGHEVTLKTAKSKIMNVFRTLTNMYVFLSDVGV